VRRAALCGLLWLGACGGGEEAADDTEVDTGTLALDSGLATADTVDTGAAAGDVCADAPVTTWENFGAGFITQNCQSCHASTAAERNGAPETVTFDTEEQALAWGNQILARVTVSEDMPPQGGLSDDQRQLVVYWLECP